MSRIGVRTLLLLAFLALLFVSSVTAFNPYSDEDDSVAGEIPQTSTVTCTLNADGSETCTSVNKEVLDEETLEAKVAEAEAERAAEEQARNEARAKREAEYQREREEKREARRKKQEERKKQHQENKDNTADSNDYKIASPLKKLRINYYQFFRVDPDASKLKIRKAANAAALMNHPDKCPSSKCKENMIIINQARDVLLDDNTRAEYDFLLRFGFKIYDKELYDDIYAQYKEDPDNVQHGWDDAASFDGSSDYSGMQVTEEGAGWLLLITGSLTLAMMAWPVIKFWEQSKTAEEKKAAQKKILLEAQSKNKLDQGSLKKKTEKYTGERSVKRFASNDKSAQKSPVA